MKKIFTILAVIITMASTFAQTPNKMSYQAVVRNGSNALVANHTVGMRISIVQGSPNGGSVYVETQTPSTNANGLASMEVGAGIVVSGIFSSINWANGPYFIKTETDPTGGSNYTITTTSQLLSVPYALHAKSAETAETARTIVAGGVSGQVLTNCNGIPTWTNSGQCPGSISALNCTYAYFSGTLYAGTPVSSYTMIDIPYVGGNGGPYPAQSVSSTGVTGLIATLPAGYFSNNNGSLTYYVSGAPIGSGTASFAFNIGGQSCSLNLSVLQSGLGKSASCGAVNVHNNDVTYGNVTDYDGNIYKTVVIGSQEWMAENLKTGTYQNGIAIPLVTNDGSWSNLSATKSGGACWYNNDSIAFNCPYGKLYNWYAVTSSNNLCPNGWHVPSDTEWSILVNYLDSTIGGGTNTYNNAGGNMKSIAYWQDPNTGADNSSGFSLLPGGVRNHIGTFNSAGIAGFWWSATEVDSLSSNYYVLYKSSAQANRSYYFKGIGNSVRCLKDNFSPVGSIKNLECDKITNTGTLIVGTVSNGVSFSIPYSGGNLGPYQAQIVNSSGVTGLTAVLSSGNFANGAGVLTYTIAGTPNSTGIANFIVTIDGKNCNIPIHVGVSSATCGASNVHNPTLQYGSLTDQEGNVYKTITIGGREWMAENLKTGTYRDGQRISGSGLCFWYNNDSLSYHCPYGRLYNNGAVASNNLCPQGWYVPTTYDWDNLIYNLGGYNVAGDKLRSVGTQYWSSPSITSSNSSGFSGLAGGGFVNGGFQGVGDIGIWWSSTREIHDLIWSRHLTNTGLNGTLYGVNSFLSVRCIK